MMTKHPKDIVRFIIKTVPDKKMKDYEGMNYFAAKPLGFKPTPKPNEVFINDIYCGKKREQVIKHEEIEAHLMQHGYPYFKAHGIANKSENKNYPKWHKKSINGGFIK